MYYCLLELHEIGLGLRKPICALVDYDHQNCRPKHQRRHEDT